MLTRSGQVPFEGMRAVASLDEAKAIANGEGASELCIIGGGEIFHQLLDQASDLYLTWVDAEVPADTHFPEVDVQDWREVSSEPHPGWVTARSASCSPSIAPWVSSRRSLWVCRPMRGPRRTICASSRGEPLGRA